MTKTLIAATALLLLGAPLAIAANSTTYAPHGALAAATPSVQCAALEQQFGKAEPGHKAMKAFPDAVKLRDAGKTLCAANKAPDGVKKLEQALKLIGVTPEVKS